MHYSGQLLSLEKLNSEIFATTGSDGNVNIWNTRLNKLMTSINIGTTVSSLKFVNKKGLLICGHEKGLSMYTVRDDFQTKSLQEVPGEIGQITAIHYMQGKVFCGGFSGRVSVF